MREFLSYTKDLLLRGGASIGGFLHGMSGGGKSAAVLLLVVMAADYLCGLAAAAMGKSPASGSLSAVGAKGLWRKALTLCVVAVAYAMDWFANEGNAMFSTAAIFFYISNEGLSLLENLALCGVPVPARLKSLLTGMKDAGGEETDDQDASGGESSNG